MEKVIPKILDWTKNYFVQNGADCKAIVGISGGKDSLTLLYALQGLRRFYPEPFELCAITVDLGFQALSPEVSNRLSPTLSSDAAAFDLKPVQELCDELNGVWHV